MLWLMLRDMKRADERTDRKFLIDYAMANVMGYASNAPSVKFILIILWLMLKRYETSG